MIALLAQSTILSEKNAPWLIIGVGVFIMTYIVVRPFLRRKNDPMDKPAFGRSLSQQRTVERQMESLLVELTEMTRQMSAQLDTRSAKLELLIKEADEKIGQLRQMQQGLPAMPTVTTPAFEAVPIPAAAPMSEPDPSHAEVYTLADRGKSVSEIAADLSRPSGEIELILALRQR
jgi:hypothetical protein